ncbi:MAG: hypothetical protein K0B87_08970 [Candidatus Syntrophosphaera sp.]|nr:hypothetical protein [Candidatus Syntrophosphaera sp.]
MSYKNVLMAVALVAVLMLVACSSVPKELTLSVKGVSITGDAKQHLKVADGDYILKSVMNTITLTPNLELMAKIEPEVPAIDPDWKLVLLDKNGTALTYAEPFSLTSPVEKIQDLLKGELGDQVLVTFESGVVTDKAIHKMIMTEAAGFEIIDANYVEVVPIEEDPVVVEKPVTKPPVTPKPPVVANEWDSVLDTYESYVNRLIVLSRKVKQGDPTAMTDFLKMKEQTETLDQRLGAAKDMTAAQLSRFQTLHQRMANALAT